MIQIKKTLLTLALLLTAVTGAWAQDVLNLVLQGTSATIKYDGNASNNPYFTEMDWQQGGDTWDGDYTTKPTITTVTIDGSCKNFSGPSLNALFAGFSGLTTINGLENLNTANVQDMSNMFYYCSSLTSLDLSSFNTASVTTIFSMFSDCSKLTTVDLSGWNTENVETTGGLFYNCSELTTVDLSSWNTAKVWNTSNMFYKCSKLENIYVGDGWSTAAVTSSNGMFTGCTKLLSMNTANPATDKTNAHTGDGGYLKVKPASGPKVTWTAETKSGTFKMPGGNVTLEPDYYPQATAAEGAVTAADADARATTDDPLVKVDATKLTGAKKLMYYVSTDATAPAYDAEGWTDVLPTAENYTEAATLYVWYYPVGTDEGIDEATATYSNGDICSTALTVTLGAAPTYAVTLNDEGLSTDEAAAWKVAKGTDQPAAFPLEGVTKGQPVTVTYTGSKKVIGVKAENKKAAVTYTLLSAVTTEDVGKVVCAAGHLHDAKTAVPDGCTAVGILGKVTETGHGLILALKDATSQNWNTINGWTSASYAGTTLKVLPDDDARGINLTSCSTLGETTVSNWAVAQKSDYDAIFTNLGSTKGDSDGNTYDANVNAYITTGVGGTAISGRYWSATERDGDNAWNFHSNCWAGNSKTSSYILRPVLGF